MKLKEVQAKLKDWRGKKPEALTEELLNVRREQFSLRLQRATGQPVKPNQFSSARRSIARLKTVAREAQLRAAGEKK